MGAWQYYAVARGANPGIYESWKQAKAAIGEYPNPKYKGFDDQDKALAFIDSYSAPRKKKKQPKQEEFTFIPAEEPADAQPESRELRDLIAIYKSLPIERKICLYLFATFIKNFSGCAFTCGDKKEGGK